MSRAVLTGALCRLICVALSMTLLACQGGNSAASQEEEPIASSAPQPTSSDPHQGTTVSGLRTTVAKLGLDNALLVPQTNVPVTLGHVFSQGDLASSDGLVAQLEDSSVVPLQVDVKAEHPDGSVRHALISTVLPTLAAGRSATLAMTKATVTSGAQSSTNPSALLALGFTSSVEVNLGGELHVADAGALLSGGRFDTWMSGPIVNEWHVSAPLTSVRSGEHPHLTARFAIRWYHRINKVRVDVTLENNWAYVPGPQNFTYDVQLKVGGVAVYTHQALTHFHHARWRKVFWWGEAPDVHVRHDAAYLLATKAVPNFDATIKPSEAGLSNLRAKWTASKREPMAPGIVLPYMPTTGGRADIGPLPQWTALYLLSMDRRAKEVALGTGDLGGSWPIHYRDKNTDRPVSIVDYPYMTLLGRAGDTVNPATKRSEQFPACGGTCATAPHNFQPDSSHQPSLAYVPYLVTGDYFYLEELHFWANWNMLQANPYYREFDKGIMKWDQVRGQAWSLRTLGHAAYITPDSHPLKKYFVDRVDENLDWYGRTYSIGMPNALGVIDGTGQYVYAVMVYATPAGPSTGIAPWQDDFFTWSVGHLWELGFTAARPLLEWKAMFPVARLTVPGYCWVDATAYSLAVRPEAAQPVYATIADAYRSSMRKSDGSALVNSSGARYLDQPCGSQAQADWRTRNDADNNVRRSPWKAGEMDGYSGSAQGYPSNLQPALAVAVEAGVMKADLAWAVFDGRAVKPDYSAEPQWAVVPRR